MAEFLYVAPHITCEKCFDFILLPYPRLPEVEEAEWRGGEYTGPSDSVPDGWHIVFGCRKCGHVGIYDAEFVGDSLVQKPNRGVFHSETNCFSVQLQCATIDCKSLATMYAVLESGENETDLIDLLKTGFFRGTLPCSHPLMPMPAERYRDPHRVLHSLW